MAGRIRRARTGNAQAFMIALAAALQIAPAWPANQDEIQVYDDTIDKPGEFGLEIHTNATPLERAYQLYPGEIANDHGFRRPQTICLEPRRR